MVGAGLFDPSKPLRAFTPGEMHNLLHAEGIPISKAHAAGTYRKTWEGIARKLERLYVDKAEDELPEDRRDAYQRYLVYGDCEVCRGLRLNPRALGVRVQGRGIGELVQLELTQLDAWLGSVDGPVAQPLVSKMRGILSHLIDMGVGYLCLGRAVSTLSGGETQRVKMARQMDCDLIGMMYVLDEPTVGLHPRDVDHLVVMLKRLRDKGNSVLVVEHDPAVIAGADQVVEIGPGAGSQGGEVCFQGTYDEMLRSGRQTARSLRSGRGVAVSRRRPWTECWHLRSARANNLKCIDVDLPQKVLVCVTGVAGSGKSSLVHEVFARQHPEAVVVDSSPIGRSSRSNPATFLGIFDDVRKVFSQATGHPASPFSFNSVGACPACRGLGTIAVEMNFLDDVRIQCSDCQGARGTPGRCWICDGMAGTSTTSSPSRRQRQWRCFPMTGSRQPWVSCATSAWAT